MGAHDYDWFPDVASMFQRADTQPGVLGEVVDVAVNPQRLVRLIGVARPGEVRRVRISDPAGPIVVEIGDGFLGVIGPVVEPVLRASLSAAQASVAR